MTKKIVKLSKEDKIMGRTLFDEPGRKHFLKMMKEAVIHNEMMRSSRKTVLELNQHEVDTANT